MSVGWMKWNNCSVFSFQFSILNACQFAITVCLDTSTISVWEVCNYANAKLIEKFTQKIDSKLKLFPSSLSTQNKTTESFE